MRRSVPNWLISSGCRAPFGFSKRSAGPPDLTVAVDDLGDLEVGVDLGGDADELALALEQRDPLAQVGAAAPSRSVYGRECVLDRLVQCQPRPIRTSTRELEAVEREHTLGRDQLVEFPRERVPRHLCLQRAPDATGSLLARRSAAARASSATPGPVE